MAPQSQNANRLQAQEISQSTTEKEAEIVQAQQPLGSQDRKDEEIVAQEELKPELPMSKARAIALVITVTAASFLNTLGVQSSVIILPTIGKALNIPDSRQQWIVSAYNLTFSCFLLLWGRLADVYGKKLIFVWGSIWITLTSLLVPVIPHEIGFDVFRGLQGLGAAAMVPTAIGILGTTFPPGKAKNYAFSCYGGGAPLGGVFGNIFGGVLGQYLEWKWVFWIFGILTAFVAVAAVYVIPPPPVKPEPKVKKAVDWIGGTIVTVGLIILLFALSEGNVVGWTTPWIGMLIGISILFLAAFGFWQYWLETKTNRQPLMKVSMFSNVRFSAANIIMLLFFTSFNNFLIYATYWFQDYQGLSIIQTTLRFIPTGVTGVLVAIATSQLLSRVRGDFILAFGTTCVALSSLLFAIPIPTTTSYWAYGFPAMVLAVCGADTLFPTLTLFVAKSLPAEDQALGGALVSMVGQFGRALGLAIATAIQMAVQAREKGVSVEELGEADVGVGDEALKDGIRGTAWFNCAIGVVALGCVGVFFRGAGKVGGKH
ncbi:MFS general substrate transporter [Bimuria novae-zelandiae CBS 107.79]|uniref:MFS general substrate transporter n=1 Tax=Bimuria novae-zelandiae CBS 107.79 TaxID=1447943 RepID=A0A6A5UI97_9PLEO|nr:MFS general substrate transporter [Bimuria novae-zelandiae CBS 107.79]